MEDQYPAKYTFGKPAAKVSVFFEEDSKDYNQQNIVDDPEAPMLYTNNFMLLYGTFFSVFAAGVLLSMNFSWIGKKILIIPTLIVSLTYTILKFIFLTEYYEYAYLIVFIPFDLAAFVLIVHLLWNRNVDRDLKYRRRPAWGAIIGFFIIFLLILCLFYFTRPDFLAFAYL